MLTNVICRAWMEGFKMQPLMNSNNWQICEPSSKTHPIFQQSFSFLSTRRDQASETRTHLHTPSSSLFCVQSFTGTTLQFHLLGQDRSNLGLPDAQFELSWDSSLSLNVLRPFCVFCYLLSAILYHLIIMPGIACNKSLERF
jgi:hypothetical protein